MTILTPEFLAWSSQEIHRAAEEHWRRHGTTPIKVVLFAGDGVPQPVDFAQGIGQEAAGRAVRTHADRIAAVAVALTAVARAAEVETDLTPHEPRAGAAVRLVGDFGRALVTLTIWPECDVTTAWCSDIRTGLDGPAVLAAVREGTPSDLAEFAGLTSWLTGLLPHNNRSVTS
jgi:hypothetical protein